MRYCVFCFVIVSMNFYMGINIAAGWLFDHGLENAIDEMKALFNKRELYILYLRHVDPLFRLEIEKTASAIQKDKKNGPEMARRLRFSDYQSFASANPRSIVEHFFIAMNHPPKKKAPLLRNAEYLKTAYTLSALFAPFDNGMKIIAKEIDGNRAQLQFHGNNLKMVAYFSRRNGKWFLTRSGI